MEPLATAYCLIGSNLGRREDHLRRATFLLADTEGVESIRASALYETQPWGNIRQPAFLNVAVALRTRLDPEALLERFLAIEQALGRPDPVEREHWGPRTVDLDLLLYDDQVIGTERLTVPHPHLAERAFALVPLLEVFPEARCPGYPEGGGRSVSPPSRVLAAPGEPYALALARLDEQERRDCQPWGALARPASEGWPSAESGSQASGLALFVSDSQDETERLGEAFAAGLRGAEVVALVGHLGAGKTCLVRGLARGLGIEGPVTSPSYVLVRSYEGRLALHHADFYRVGGEAPGGRNEEGEGYKGPGTGRRPSRADEGLELASLGLEDYLDDPGAVVVVEWADHFPAWLEPPYWRFDLTGSGGAARWILVRRIR